MNLSPLHLALLLASSPAAPAADEPPDDSAALAADADEDEDDDDDDDDDDGKWGKKIKIEAHFELGGLGYQGNLTRQAFDAPAGAEVLVERHGGELLGGGAYVAAVRDDFWMSWFHSRIGHGGLHFGGTPTPTLSDDAVAAGKPEPRSGFNFGLFGSGRTNSGVSFGGVCGFGLSLLTRGSVKAYTRSTVPGNHITISGGLAGGLHCQDGKTFSLVQWSVDGSVGAEQMQVLRYQQGNEMYSPSLGTGLLLYPSHGPVLTLVHDGERLKAALSGHGFWSFGRGKYGGRRVGVRAELAVALAGKRLALGLAPWYQFERIEYTADTKVQDPNTRFGHTFGVSLVYVLPSRD